jgi:hypothetical protein
MNDAENEDQLPRQGTERLQRKPVPRNESSIPLMSLNADTEVLNAEDVANLPNHQPEKSPESSTTTKKYFASHPSRWTFELIAAAVSIAAMVSLIGVLYSYDNRVVQTLSLGITLNGLVAILSTICRTALMIPVAAGLSQGKWLWFSLKREGSGRRLLDLETFDSASRGSGVA